MGGSADDINETKTSLTAYRGQSANARWQLAVKDTASGDVGYVESWTVTVRYSTPTASYSLTVQTLIDVGTVGLNGATVTAGSSSQQTSGGSTVFTLAAGSYTLTVPSTVSVYQFSHFYDAGLSQDTNYNGSTSYSITLSAARQITAYYKRPTQIVNLGCTGSSITGKLLDNLSSALLASGNSTVYGTHALQRQVLLEYFDGSWHAIGSPQASSGDGAFSQSWTRVAAATKTRASYSPPAISSSTMDAIFYIPAPAVECNLPQAPSASRASPSASTLTLSVGQSQTFTASATDPDGNLRGIDWYVNGGNAREQDVLSGGSGQASFTFTFASAGTYTVEAQAHDTTNLYSSGAATATWTVTVPQASSLTVQTLIDVGTVGLNGATVTVGSSSQQTSGGSTVFTLAAGSYTLTVPSTVSVYQFSHFYDAGLNQDTNYNGSTSYAITLSGTRQITAYYKRPTQIMNLGYSGSSITGKLVDNVSSPLLGSGNSTVYGTHPLQRQVLVEYFDGSWHTIGSPQASSSDGTFSQSWTLVAAATKIRASYSPPPITSSAMDGIFYMPSQADVGDLGRTCFSWSDSVPIQKTATFPVSGVTVTATVNFTLTPSAAVCLWTTGLWDVHATLDGSIAQSTPAGAPTVSLSVTGALDKDDFQVIFAQPLTVFPVGWVLVVPQISIILDTNVHITAQATANLTQQPTTARFTIASDGWQLTSGLFCGVPPVQVTSVGDFVARCFVSSPLSASTIGSVKATVWVQLSFLVYGLAGPYVQVGPAVTLQGGVSNDVPLWGSLCGEVDAGFGVTGNPILFGPTRKLGTDGPIFGPGLLASSPTSIHTCGQPVGLKVTRVGTGTGTITGLPSGIACGTTCAAPFDVGTVVTLTALPDANSIFTGWNGAGCSGVGACHITMDANKSVTANFSPQQFSLTVNCSGASFQVAPQNCGATQSYNSGTVVTLTASPTTGITYTWTGVDSSSGNIATVTMNANKTVGVSGVTHPGAFQFSAPTYSVGEGGGSVTVTVQRVNGSDGAVSVQYATSNGSATAGSDYTAASGTLNWGSGDATAKTFSVPILEDTLVEGNETVNLTLSNPTGGASLGTPSTAVLTIVDNDVAVPGAFQFNAPTYSVSEGGGSLTITVQRVNGSDGAVSVQYATNNGSATAGSDYTAASGALNWGNGDAAAKTFSIPILEDTLVEGNETVNLTLSNPTGGASLGTPSTAVLTIVDNDVSFAATTSFNPTSIGLGTGGTGTIAVEVTGLPAGADAVQINIQHPSFLIVTSPACVGILAGGSPVPPAAVTGGTLIGCFLQTGNVSGTSGQVLTFILTRTGAGTATVTMGVGGGFGTQFTDNGSPIGPGTTNTLQVTEGTTISGKVTLQGRTGQLPSGTGNNAPPVVTLNPGNRTVAVAVDGTFQITGVAPGTYTLTASWPGYLSAEKAGLVVGSTPVTMTDVQLHAGLVNSDSVVNIQDISATVAAFGTTPANRVDSQGRFVDQNGDGFVNIQDISLVVSSFGQSSPQTWP